MPSLAEHLAAIPASRKGPRCTMWHIERAMTAEDRATLAKALADPSMTLSTIVRALQASGHRVGRHTLERHKKGECSCGAG